MATRTTTASGEETSRVVRAYFEELEQGSADAPLRHYAPDATAEILGRLERASREGVAAMFREIHGAFPDYRFEILDIVAQDDRAAVLWRITGTFAGPGELDGFEPTGGSLDVKGIDLVRVRDGRIAHIEAYTDNMTIARQLGLLPSQDSSADQRMTAALNARTRMARRIAAAQPEQIAEGVWVVRGGFPMKTMNVYLLEDDGGVTVFDAGISDMSRAVAASTQDQFKSLTKYQWRLT